MAFSNIRGRFRKPKFAVFLSGIFPALLDFVIGKVNDSNLRVKQKCFFNAEKPVLSNSLSRRQKYQI